MNELSNNFTEYTDLGVHGYNQLFKAKRYGKWFLLKGLKPEFREMPLYLSLMAKEFELSIALDHPNIVNTVETRHDPKIGDCIVMEYVDGLTLKEFAKTRHSQPVYHQIVMELLDAMRYYHGKQLIHCDLKPSNILITRNGNHVKIIDFGLSDNDTFAIFKDMGGTADFMAPEQKDTSITIDSRVDIYAFGKILHTLFVGHIPLKYKHIIRRCTRKDRDKRYPSAQAIQQALHADQQLRRASLYTLSVTAIIVLTLFVAHLFQPKTATQAQANVPTHDTTIVKSNTQGSNASSFSQAQQEALIAKMRKQMNRCAGAIIRKWDPRNYSHDAYRELLYQDQGKVWEHRYEPLTNIKNTLCAQIQTNDPFYATFCALTDQEIDRQTRLLEDTIISLAKRYYFDTYD